MKEDFDKPYDPKSAEARIYQLWEEGGFFDPDKLKTDKKKKTYSILLPPPNVTGSLHLGHALNATVSDILIRFNRMTGKKTVWLPGIDHAGIATQNVVEKELRKQGTSRYELGREKFIERVWQWKEQYGSIILDQFKRLGASCDWSRLRFTLDEKYADEVLKTFVHYYEKGLIYRGSRVVNWCPRCRTSLSDLEVRHEETKTKLWYIKYPLAIKNAELRMQNYIVVATTRPETMLGDTAVAVNPSDPRYKNLVGQKVILPIQNKKIPIIADRNVDKDFGTGAVKVTPAHSFTDFEIGEKNGLEIVEVIGQDGRMTELAGINFAGLKIDEAREKIVQELEKEGLLEKIEDYNNYVGHCDRCNAVLEQLISPQWFLRMDHLKDFAVKIVRSGKTKIIPKNFEKTYLSWLNNVRDWCISRQIWWGHRLPVYFCEQKTEEFTVSLAKPDKCPICGNCKMKQSEDVLDTWFSSALWPFAALSKKDLQDFYPSQVLITARDIINLWVARMIFSGMEFKSETPFEKTLIHATILTKDGKRMSKSKGTGIDPLILIDNFGADALRFGIIWQSMGNQDIRFDETAVMAGKKFANKIWNATRFVLQNAESKAGGKDSKSKPKTPADKKVLDKLQKAKKSVEKDINSFKFGQALHKVYDFFWHDFCDVYIEKSKKQSGDKTFIFFILLESLKLIHPFMPFVTEEIYQKIKPKGSAKALMIEKWD
ncbi:MAG: valine--tRNA ligase [Candidatus Paceibacterota bacterium]|jgi:valyl-tRNA synthetase